MSDFNYSAYFSPITPLADAQRENTSCFWEARSERLTQSHEYVLYLGCNVLRTTHLAEAVVAVLEAMNVDFIALGGPAVCCGAIHERAGDGLIGTRLAQRTLDKFAQVRPKAVLTFCPSCYTTFDEKLASGALKFGLPHLHVTQFIAEHLDRPSFKKPIRRRIGLHAHHGTAASRRDSLHTLSILQAIPGLDVVELPADDEWGYMCTTSVIEKIGVERHRALVADMFETAKKRDCDGVATVYHSCYRELIRVEREHGIEWLNYLELLAASLELGPFPPRYKEFALAGDPEGAYSALAARAIERGVDPDSLRRAVETHFAPAP